MEEANVDFGIFPNYLKPLNFHKPSLIIIHDLSFYSHPQFYSKAFVLYYKDQLRKVLKSDPLIATVSNYSRASIHKYLGIGEDRIFLLQAYVECDKFRLNKESLSEGFEKPYFLYVGHIEPRKNLSFLIRNFIKWKTAGGIDMKLKIVGDLWQNSKEVKEILDNYSQHPDIEFTGYVEEDELHRLYSNAAGFVHTSIVEGFGFPVLEAMHYGLPVLCSASSSMEEITFPHSITVDPYTDSELLLGFDRLLLKSHNRNSKPEIHYSPELMRNQLELILESFRGEKKSFFYNASQTEVETAVQKTLLYYKLFNSGLSVDILYSYLLNLKVTRHQLNNAIVSLLKKNIISISENILCLNTEINKFYIRKNNSPDRKLTERLLRLLKNVPFITAIAFSGGTANYGLENHDDIDLFIITRPFTVYIVYMLIHFISLVLKSRNVLCVNYLVDENAAEIKIQRDLFTAHQIIALKPFKNEKYFNYFLYINSWILDYYPNYIIPELVSQRSSPLYNLFRPFNWVLWKLYRMWYKQIINSADEESVILTCDIMKLHTNNYRKKVVAEFETQWAEYLNRKEVLKSPNSIAK
ncbi:MAG: glycosyltransferase family 4 protein [Ignavibacteriales bacterium]